MIEIISALLVGIGTIIATSSLFIDNNFKRFATLLIIGAIIMFIGCGLVISISKCQRECKDQDLIFSHQEYNQCSEELTCYCKQPITQPKPKVVIIE